MLIISGDETSSIGLRWEGVDFDRGILTRLNDDVSLAQTVLSSNTRLEITAYPEHGCYILTVRTFSIPSNRLWNCYQTIAGHLLNDGGMKPEEQVRPK